MKKAIALGLAAGVMSLAGCNNTPREQAAENIEAGADAVADNLEDAADNAGTEASEDSLENQAAAVRDAGENTAADMRTNDPDTNLKNGL